MKVDFIIVGQGLAGTLLASKLEDLSKTFIIFDERNPLSASLQAAGIINPVTGRRFVKSWNYDQLEKTFLKEYQIIEYKIQHKLLYDHEIYLCLSSIKEENDLLAQSNDYKYEDKLKFIGKVNELNERSYKSVYSIQGYRLYVNHLCKLFRNQWLSQNKLIDQKFDYTSLRIEKTNFLYKEIQAQFVVFCEGAFANQNPFFLDNGVIPNKGQYLIIDIDHWYNEASIKDKIIISRFQDHQWAGATYEWSFEHTDPTNDGKLELTKQIDKIIANTYQIKKHAVGLRPTTKDRRPIMIQHQQINNMWMMNGLGTKGSSIAPFLVNEFVRQVVL